MLKYGVSSDMQEKVRQSEHVEKNKCVICSV